MDATPEKSRLTAGQLAGITARPARPHRKAGRPRGRIWSADEFDRSRGRIAVADRSAEWKRRAMRHLIRQSGAVEHYAGSRMIGYRMPRGDISCLKLRFSNEAAAMKNLEDCMSLSDVDRRRERRAYRCPECKGWHLTSLE